jgi:hypothetical protein
MLVLMHAYNIQKQLKYKILNPVSCILINYALIWYVSLKMSLGTEIFMYYLFMVVLDK